MLSGYLSPVGTLSGSLTGVGGLSGAVRGIQFAGIGITAVLEQVNWLTVLSASVLAGILSMLMSLSGLPAIVTQASILYSQEVGWKVDIKTFTNTN